MAAVAETLQTMSRRPSRNTGHLYFLEAKYELLKTLRLPAYAVPTIAFPLVFYVFFGLAFRGKGGGGVSMAQYLIATYGVFGVMGAALFGFGIGVALERGQGWLQVKRATPMPLAAYFAAKLVMSMLFSLVIVVLLLVLGTFGGVHLPPAAMALLILQLVVGSAPFCAMGLAIGYFAGPNSAVPLVNLLYLPMAFASGLWIPLQVLPKFLQTIAPFLPPYHLAQLALTTVGAANGGRALSHVIALAGFTGLFLILASIGYSRDEGKTYG